MLERMWREETRLGVVAAMRRRRRRRASPIPSKGAFWALTWCGRSCREGASAAKAHKAARGATTDMHSTMALEQVSGTTVNMAGAAFAPDSRDKDCDASVGDAPSGALPLRCSSQCWSP